MDTPQYLTISEVAERCQAHHLTVRRWIKEGRLRSFRAGARHLITEADLLAFLTPVAQAQPAPRQVA